jgi:hypothetical protein
LLSLFVNKTVSPRARFGGAAGGAAAVIGRAQFWDWLRILSKRREFSKRLYYTIVQKQIIASIASRGFP